VGAGINYTFFYNQDADSVRHLKVKDQVGAALQVGFDYMIDQHWGVNFDVKKLFLEPKFNATLADGTRVHGKAEINPWLVSGGVTYRF
jgi:outer membrane protein